MLQKVTEILIRIKQEKPLVLNITNDVTINFVANGLLSVGASPVMSKADQEIEDLVKIAKAVVINIGTLNKQFVSLCDDVCLIANKYNKPIIFDPVGAGASTYRTDTCLKIINEYSLDIIRGNASEIMALTHSSFTTKGVDSTQKSTAVIEHAHALSKLTKATVVVSGQVDVIVADDKINQSDRGSALMPLLTGSGCLLSAVIAAFRAEHHDSFEAATAACIFYGICGEVAEKSATGPGTFKTQFLDALYFIEQHHYAKK